MDPNILQLATVGGAAGALFWVLKLVTDGKLHSSSEVDGLKQDKADLLTIVRSLGESLRKSNETDRQILSLLRRKPDGSPE